MISVVVFYLMIMLLLVFRTGDSPSVKTVSFAATDQLKGAEEELSFEPTTERSASTMEAMSLEIVELSASRASAEHALSGLIVDLEGASVTGADLLWMSLEESCDSVRASTSEAGRFEFNAVPSALRRSWSALWVLHPAHFAELIVFEPGGDVSELFGALMELEEAPGFVALATSSEGEPLQGVHVEQRIQLKGLSSLNEAITGRDSAEVRARAIFSRTALSDSSGAALLLPLRGDSFLMASFDAERSVAWEGPSEGTAVLELHESFNVQGHVRGDIALDTWVRCEGVSFGEESLLGEFEVSAGGGWGPVSLPFLDVDEYVFTLRGEVAASEVRVPRDELSDQMIINMDCLPGTSFALAVLGVDDAPLGGAKVTAHWKQDGSWQAVGDRTDREGLCRMHGVPEGAAYVRVRAEGHIAQMIGPLEVIEGMNTIEVQLLVAGRIAGRCLREGEPVENFKLLYWSEDPSQVSIEEVSSSEDGSFLIQEAPLGEVTIIGLDEEVANGSPQLVFVSAGETSEVRIDLPRSSDAAGVVVDAVTGEVVSGARVQVMSSFEGRGLAEFGPEESSDVGGRFAMKGLPGSVGSLRVTAEGYITKYLVTHGKTGSDLDLGLIAVQPSRELIVQLEGLSEMSYAGYRVGLVRHGDLGVVEVNHQGLVRFKDIPNGVVELNIYHPDDSVTAFAGSLQPEDDGRFVVPVSGGQRLYVNVTSDSSDGLPLDLFVGVGGMREDGSEIVRWLHHEGAGRFLLETAQPGPAVVRAVNLQGDVYAIRRVEVPEGRDAEVSLELEAEEDFIIRVVDAEERPVYNAMVRIYLPSGDPCFFVRELFSDSGGEVRVHGFGFPHAQVTVTHEAMGSGDVGLVDVDALDGEPLLIRLDAPARLRILVSDGGHPVAAASAVLRAREPLVNGDGFGVRTTDRDGSATWESLMQVEYELSVHGVGLWPSRRRITPGIKGDRQLVEVRRTGQLSMLIYDERGHAISGVEVDLRLTRSGESVAGWIAEGLLPASAAVTDGSGRLSLPSLPHGSWSWTALTLDGRAGAGFFDLSAGESREVVGLLQ